MKQPKYTRGPWTLRQDSRGEECGAVIGADGMLVATTGYRASPEDDANARLIADAPALLDLLRDICCMTHENSGDLLKRGRAIVAKHDGQ